MNRKALIDRLQNLVMILLAVSALFLLSRLPLLSGGWGSRVQALFTASPSGSGQGQSSSLTETISSVHLMVTDDIEYGRYSQLHVPTDSLPSQITPLFQEALGSASVLGITADKTLQEALRTPSIYLDLTIQLPLSVVAAWLDEAVGFERDVRAMALTTEEEDTAILYLYSTDGSIFRYETALTVSAVRSAVREFSPNNGSFAFESNYAPLAPYTILVAQAPSLPDISSSIPDGYSDYNLLSALDFNPHTNFRYVESNGVEVVEDSPRSLRIAPDGTVSYSVSGEVASALYSVPCAGEAPTATEALLAAQRLAAALSAGTGASPLFLYAIEATESGWTIAFRYQSEGCPVLLPGDKAALSIVITGQSITAFTYLCRSYAPIASGAESEAGGQQLPLLPPSIAVAVASLRPGAGLSIGYVDNGAEQLSACWLAG